MLPLNVLIVIENIAERCRVERLLSRRFTVVAVKSAQGGIDFLRDVTPDVVISDLVIGDMPTSDLVAQAQECDGGLPCILCLVGSLPLTRLQTNCLCNIQDVDGVDLMRKTEVESGLLQYLDDRFNLAEELPEPVDISDAEFGEQRAPLADRTSLTPDDVDEPSSSIVRLDQNHEELAEAVSHIHETTVAIQKQLSILESRMQAMEGAVDVNAPHES